jgi:hypothetical protein
MARKPALEVHVTEIHLKRFCWDGWRATVIGLPLIHADAEWPDEAAKAVTDILKKEAEHAAKA